MNPGSKVNTPCSFNSGAMLMTSGPMVPELASSCVIFPVVWFLHFVFRAHTLVRAHARLSGFYGPSALHGEGTESSSGSGWTARAHLACYPTLIFGSRRPRWRTSCGICRPDRRCPRLFACRYRTDGSSNRLRPAGHVRSWNSSGTCFRTCRLRKFLCIQDGIPAFMETPRVGWRQNRSAAPEEAQVGRIATPFKSCPFATFRS